MAEEPHSLRAVRYNRKWFLAVAAALVAGVVGALAGLRHHPSSGGAARSSRLAKLLSSFPTLSVEEVPRKTLAEWVVTVDGLVDRPLRIDAAMWRGLERRRETVEFNCVEGWSVDNVEWGGVAPGVVLAMAGAQPEGKHVIFHALGGQYLDSLPLELVLHPQTLLADALDGEPLPAEHGGPIRLVVPAQLGYKNVKWVTRLEVSRTPAVGYWERRGYPSDAPVKE